MLRKILSAAGFFFLYLIVILLANVLLSVGTPGIPGGAIFLFLLMLLLLLPPASYLAARYAFLHLQPEITTSLLFGHSGDEITVSFVLKNPAYLPLPDCTFHYTVSSPFYPNEESYEVNCPVYAHDSFAFSIPLTFRRAACYQIRLTQITVWDYLHFFNFHKEVTLQKELFIFPPENDNLQFSSAAFGEGFDEFEENGAKGNISSNVTDIREYIPGDRLQKIHWKLSAKIHKLMVKENEQTSSHQFILLPELYLPDPAQPVLEQILSNTLTMGRSLLADGITFFFRYYSIAAQDFMQFCILNEDQLEEAFRSCFYESTYAESDLALTVLQKADMVHGSILHVTDKGVEDVIS